MSSEETMNPKISESTTVTVSLFIATTVLVIGFAVDYVTTRANAQVAVSSSDVLAKEIRGLEKSLIRLEIKAGVYDPQNWK